MVSQVSSIEAVNVWRRLGVSQLVGLRVWGPIAPFFRLPTPNLPLGSLTSTKHIYLALGWGFRSPDSAISRLQIWKWVALPAQRTYVSAQR